MKNTNNRIYVVDKKRVLREQDHLTRPPRLEGRNKNFNTNPVKKAKGTGKGN
jgi:hypothetical protein